MVSACQKKLLIVTREEELFLSLVHRIHRLTARELEDMSIIILQINLQFLFDTSFQH